MIATRTLLAHANELLDVDAVRDWSPNGLQVEGRDRIRRLMTGVTACQPLLEAAVEWDADMLLVHHGWFWKGEPPQVIGMRRLRMETVLAAGFNLVAYHLPLDIHPDLGNNAELGRMFGIDAEGRENVDGIPGLLWHGRLGEALTPSEFAGRIARALDRKPLHLGPEGGTIQRVAWCSGAAHDLLEQAADLGVDAFVTGEVAERTTHVARELGVHCFAAGHHATERCGVHALGEHLAARFDLEHRFTDIDNPV
jgi:dinuclear metal center YbgI/SA1388 family protein